MGSSLGASDDTEIVKKSENNTPNNNTNNTNHNNNPIEDVQVKIEAINKETVTSSNNNIENEEVVESGDVNRDETKPTLAFSMRRKRKKITESQ